MEVVADRRVEIDLAARRLRHDQLLHVEVRRVEQPAPLRRREHGNRTRRTGRTEVRAFQRIDGDVDLRSAQPAPPVHDIRQTDLLADEQHRRFVALAFADDDRPVDGDRVELAAHRHHCGLIGLVTVSLPHRVRARDGGLLDDPKEVQGKV
jgi:hypothetical protein